jgi:hypothetical protein
MKEIQRMKKEHRKKKGYKKKEILREIRKQEWVPVGNIFVNPVLWVFLMKELKNTSTKSLSLFHKMNAITLIFIVFAISLYTETGIQLCLK